LEITMVTICEFVYSSPWHPMGDSNFNNRSRTYAEHLHHFMCHPCDMDFPAINVASLNGVVLPCEQKLNIVLHPCCTEFPAIHGNPCIPMAS